MKPDTTPIAEPSEPQGSHEGTQTTTFEATNQLIDLSGKRIVVTGAAAGIGLGIAKRLHDAGGTVIIADIDVKGGADVAEDFNSIRPGSAMSVATDVGNSDDISALFAALVERYAGIDVLVNNAGIFPVAGFLDMDRALVEEVLRVNLVGPILVMQAAARQMIAQGAGGKIINITSVNAVKPSPSGGKSIYDASKAGLWGITRSSALELVKHGITVTALAPGAIVSPGTSSDPRIEKVGERVPLGRRGQPDELGRAALFLASDLASYITASQIIVDGGLTQT